MFFHLALSKLNLSIKAERRTIIFVQRRKRKFWWMVIGGHPIPNSLKFFLITIELKSYLRTNIFIASPHLLIQMCKIPKLQHVVNSPSSFFFRIQSSLQWRGKVERKLNFESFILWLVQTLRANIPREKLLPKPFKILLRKMLVEP